MTTDWNSPLSDSVLNELYSTILCCNYIECTISHSSVYWLDSDCCWIPQLSDPPSTQLLIIFYILVLNNIHMERTGKQERSSLLSQLSPVLELQSSALPFQHSSELEPQNSGWGDSTSSNLASSSYQTYNKIHASFTVFLKQYTVWNISNNKYLNQTVSQKRIHFRYCTYD